jgi:putative oxidoreductase
MNRFLPTASGDLALLTARIILGVVLFAHGIQKMIIDGFAKTFGLFEAMGIPLAIVSSSFVTVVEFVGGLLLLLGALTRIVVTLHIVVMVGAAIFVHASHGIFAADGGWELVGVIAACELTLAAVGPGRYSIDHLLLRRRDAGQYQQKTALATRAESPTSPTRSLFDRPDSR